MSKLKDVVRAQSTNVVRLKRGRDSRSHVGSRAGSLASNILVAVSIWAFNPAKSLDMSLLQYHWFRLSFDKTVVYTVV